MVRAATVENFQQNLQELRRHLGEIGMWNDFAERVRRAMAEWMGGIGHPYRKRFLASNIG